MEQQPSPPVTAKDGLLYLGKTTLSSKGVAGKIKHWQHKWFVLAGSSLYYYNKTTSFAPIGDLELQKLQVVEEVEDKVEREHVFALKDTHKGKLYFLSAESEEQRRAWINIILENKNKDPHPPPENANASAKKGVMYSLETNVASSVFGKKLIKDSVPQEAWQVLDNVCSFLAQSRGSDTAKLWRKYFLKICIKLGLLNYNKVVADSVLFRWKKTFLRLSAIVVDFYQMPSVFDVQLILDVIHGLKKDMDENLVPKLTPKSVTKLEYVFGIMGDATLLSSFFERKKWKELEAIATIIRNNVNILRQHL